MHVHCPHCGAQIPADDLNVDSAIARCRTCNAVFSFADALDRERGGPVTRSAASDEVPVPQPRGLHVEDWDGNLRITRRWFSPAFIFLVFFCAFWDEFLVFWYSIAFGGDAPWIMAVFPILHVAVGIGLTYFTLCGFVNRTVITVDAGQLAIRHGPLPWPGNRVVPTGDLEQLYCRERLRHSNRGRTSVQYELHAATVGGGRIKLLGMLDDPEHALFLEQRIEQYLGITDRPVRGEYRG
ncbi:MAG: hypothetical protein PVJ57_05825 [Phycisphaerae bacterium]|jgi:predicted Zn finger-like uncharacterized protein